MKDAPDRLQKKAGRPQNDVEAKSAADLAEETKNFNIALRADFQMKGKTHPGDLTVEAQRVQIGFLQSRCWRLA